MSGFYWLLHGAFHVAFVLDYCNFDFKELKFAMVDNCLKSQCCIDKLENPAKKQGFLFGAGGGGRTRHKPSKIPIHTTIL